MSKILMGAIVLPDRVMHGTISIADGQIERIEEGFPANSEHAVDFRGKYLLPGLIEVHGHMREPGLEYKEDISSGTRTGLAGGYTTILDMPNTRPPTTTNALLAEQIKRYESKSFCDFAINMGTSRENIPELKNVHKDLITGVKIFTAGHATTPTTIPHLSDLARVFEILGERGIMALVHAENQELIDFFIQKYRDQSGRHDPAAWSDARNLSVVLTSVLEMITLAKHFGVKLYLLHQSTPEEFLAIEFGRKLGVDVYGEVTTVHLAFSSADYAQYGNLINIAPALRTPDAQEKLWQLLREGKIDTVVTDHAPHTLAEKQKESVWDVASGMPGLQEAVPVLVSNWVKRFGRETLEEGLIRIAQVTSGNIARIFGFVRKGELAVGKDADIVVIDTERPWEVRKEDLLTRNQWSVYEGMSLIGRPVATFLRGNAVYADRKVIGAPQGRRVERAR